MQVIQETRTFENTNLPTPIYTQSIYHHSVAALLLCHQEGMGSLHLGIYRTPANDREGG